ncbi:putative tRNA pseudouridylate synthase [Paratrimastix pyriformis]|uniref:tRNA pseudouridylate synthase n=1 Tax=Paratrimastix pyriformis TaxID=342808 RepID=A0ABQ8ULG0_9EUKA|nr:putative tRNA pseudouridylate synthase [Paratrimastix pyriformis]
MEKQAEEPHSSLDLRVLSHSQVVLELFAQARAHPSSIHKRQQASPPEKPPKAPKVDKKPLTDEEFPSPTGATPPTSGKSHREARKKDAKAFDVNQHGRRYVAMRLAYLGEKYNGFAIQPNTPDTIEGHLFEALEKTRLIADRTSCSYSRCGRTDKGVSAFGQVIALYVRSNFTEGPGVYPPIAAPAAASATPAASPAPPADDAAPKAPAADPSSPPTPAEAAASTPAASPAAAPAPEVAPAGDCARGKRGGPAKKAQHELDYVAMLNGVLPPEIRVLGWQDAPTEFDARFSCLHRTYKYFFVRGSLDIEKMREGARKFLGLHDFTNFCKIDRSTKVKSFKRVILAADISPVPALQWSAPTSPRVVCLTPHSDVDQNVLSASTHTLPHPKSPVLASMLGARKTRFSVGSLFMTITGHAFLWHQIRCMMSVLFRVGLGQQPPDQLVDRLLDLSQVPIKPQYEMAADLPLVLWDCGFEELYFTHDPESHGRLVQHLADLLRGHLLRSAAQHAMLDAVLGMTVRPAAPAPSPATEARPPGPPDGAAELVAFRDLPGRPALRLLEPAVADRPVRFPSQEQLRKLLAEKARLDAQAHQGAGQEDDGQGGDVGEDDGEDDE